MSYQEYLRSSQSQKPSCWGNERSFDPSDSECSNCRFRHSCAAAIEREGRGYSSSSSSSSSSGSSVRVNRGRDEAVAGRFEAAQIEPNEKPIERFLKDSASGALRGMFYEMYSFWRNYRFK